MLGQKSRTSGFENILILRGFTFISPLIKWDFVSEGKTAESSHDGSNRMGSLGPT